MTARNGKYVSTSGVADTGTSVYSGAHLTDGGAKWQGRAYDVMIEPPLCRGYDREVRRRRFRISINPL